MGSQQSVIRFLVQDNEFSSVFTKHHLKNLDCINYLCGKKLNFTKEKINNNNILTKHMDLTSISEISTLLSDKNHILEYDTDSLTEQITDELKNMTSEGFDIDLILSGRCSPIIDIFTELINNKTISPGKINLYIVINNNKYSDKILFQSMFSLQKTTNEHAITLNINEFNTFNSIGKGLKNCNDKYEEYKNCYTSEQFSKKIFELAPVNLFAKDIINYSISTHQALIKKIVRVLNNSLVTMDVLGCDISDVKYVQDSINFYINDIIEESKEPSCENLYKLLNIEGCQKLSTDLQKIIVKISEELQRINDSTDILEDDSKFIKEKLLHIYNWFVSKEHIVKNNLIYFPLHNLAIVLMVKDSALLTSQSSYGVIKNKIFNIVKDRPTNTDDKFINIKHNICSETPTDVLTELENLVLDVVSA
jgi:hypothetical protein